MNAPRISRRAALGAIAGAAALVAGGIALDRLLDGDPSPTRPTPPLDVGDDELDALARVGNRYLELEPATAPSIERDLAHAGVDASDPHDVKGLTAAAARDFAAGETVLIDGWVVSRSEARVAALAALARR